jgi:cytochrome b6
MKTLTYRFALQRTATILAVTTLSLVLLAGLTGILLAYYYTPTAGGAFESLKQITASVPSGSLIRSLHGLAGNGLIIVALLQLVVLFLGRQFRASWLTAWISGIFYTLVAIALSWTAIILDWDQVGYWRFKIELQTVEALPLVGSTLRDILTGGNGVNTTTVEHLYTLHSYVLSGVALVLAIAHLGSLIYQEHDRQQIRQRLESMATEMGLVESESAIGKERDSERRTATR